MGCCLSKTEENQDKMFDPNTCPNEYEEIQESNQNLLNEAGSFATAVETQSGECDYEELRKDRQWVERIETNKDRIVLSVDPKADDEKIAKDVKYLKKLEKILKKRPTISDEDWQKTATKSWKKMQKE